MPDRFLAEGSARRLNSSRARCSPAAIRRHVNQWTLRGRTDKDQSGRRPVWGRTSRLDRGPRDWPEAARVSHRATVAGTRTVAPFRPLTDATPNGLVGWWRDLRRNARQRRGRADNGHPSVSANPGARHWTAKYRLLIVLSSSGLRVHGERFLIPAPGRVFANETARANCERTSVDGERFDSASR